MAIRRKPLILAIVAALAAIAVALPVGFAAADDQPDSLVHGIVSPAIAGQNIGVSVGGVACTKAVIPSGAPNGITDATGEYFLLLRNCPAGRATVTVNGALTSAQFDLVPGVPFMTANVGSFHVFVPEVARDNP